MLSGLFLRKRVILYPINIDCGGEGTIDSVVFSYQFEYGWNSEGEKGYSYTSYNLDVIGILDSDVT